MVTLPVASFGTVISTIAFWPTVILSALTDTVEFTFNTFKVVELMLGTYWSSPIYVTLILYVPLVNPTILTDPNPFVVFTV